MDLQQIYATDSGKLIRKHLETVIEEMDKKTNINQNLTASELAVEVLSDIKAIYKLKEILQITNPEKTKSDVIKMEIGKKYGL